MTTSAHLPDRIGARPSTQRVVEAVLTAFPEHAGYVAARFAEDQADFLDRNEEVAGQVAAICGDRLDVYAADYRWMCERFLEEELHFARTGAYRLSTFAEALEQVYGDPAYMERYVRGILISQVMWTPHARAMDLFRTKFLPSLKAGARYLEIGPGHGLFLYWAARSAVSSLTAWDVSASSLQETRATLRTLGVERDVALEQVDVLARTATPGSHDAAVISEVLEHLERPADALATLHAALTPGGRLYVNVPINSPAPDHIHLLRSPAEAEALVESAGFRIDSVDLLAVTGVALERALRKRMSVSCVIIATRTA